MRDENKYWTFLLNPREMAVGLDTEQKVLTISSPLTDEDAHAIYDALTCVRELGRNSIQVDIRERARDRGGEQQ